MSSERSPGSSALTQLAAVESSAKRYLRNTRKSLRTARDARFSFQLCGTFRHSFNAVDFRFLQVSYNKHRNDDSFIDGLNFRHMPPLFQRNIVVCRYARSRQANPQIYFLIIRNDASSSTRLCVLSFALHNKRLGKSLNVVT